MALSIGELVVFTLTSFFFFGRVSRETQNICRYQTLKAEVESKTIRTISLGVRSKQNKETYKLHDPFLWMRFSCLKGYRATTRRQFTF